ncbi:MAG: hypothetical protein HY403_02325 [Elusimicrobia bacterium]|nr:hypothetical protein [Elusimicrobiota bacterium]
MTAPRRDLLAQARRALDEAAGALVGMRRLAGAAEPSEAPAASWSAGRSAVAAAREEARRLAAELENARAQGGALLSEIARLRAELEARPTAERLLEARAAGESDAARRAAESAREVVALRERVALLSAERVRLETLRSRAESFGAESESSRRLLEETLRRDLRAAHAALDRAAAEAGTRDARAIGEIQEMRARLDQALGRLQRGER